MVQQPRRSVYQLPDSRRALLRDVQGCITTWGVSMSTAARWISVGFVQEPKQIVPGEQNWCLLCYFGPKLCGGQILAASASLPYIVVDPRRDVLGLDVCKRRTR